MKATFWPPYRGGGCLEPRLLVRESRTGCPVRHQYDGLGVGEVVKLVRLARVVQQHEVIDTLARRGWRTRSQTKGTAG